MIRVLLIAILFFVIARSFWRVVDGILDGAGGAARQDRKMKPSMKLVRDPVCGTFVAQKPELSLTRRGETHYFCSEKCRNAFR